jgi:hypothetical integral membrane protein (TIGR02206 family)
METFQAFSALHLVTILAFALCWAVFVRCGLRAARSASRARAWRLGLGGWVLLAWCVANGAQVLPRYYVASENLPLQVCDIAGLLAAFAIWLPGRTLRGLLYFWGAGFSVVAILTPELVRGPAHLLFWTFWVPHANLTGTACYLLIVERLRPGWRDALLAFAWALVYLALILPFDLLSGYNYGYVGPGKPAQASLIDWLGPWPWRVAVMAALTAVVFAALAWPWVHAAARTRKPRSSA